MAAIASAEPTPASPISVPTSAAGISIEAMRPEPVARCISWARCTAIRADVASETDVQYLRVYIRSLRQKIEADPERPRHILTETGVGYRLRAPDWDAVATPSGS